MVSGSKNAYIVQVNGDVRQTGYSIKVEKGGIRPAMWIDLTKFTGQ